MPSDIHVFVSFKEPSVFAGEELQCTITFKNVANLRQEAAPDPRAGRPSRRLSFVGPLATTPRFAGPAFNFENSDVAVEDSYRSRNNGPSTHKATASLNLSASSGTPPGSSPSSAKRPFVRPTHKHQRSVSIISLGSPEVESPNEANYSTQLPQRTRPPLGHKRASTVQILPNVSGEASKSTVPSIRVPDQSGYQSGRNIQPPGPRSQSGSRGSTQRPSIFEGGSSTPPVKGSLLSTYQQPAASGSLPANLDVLRQSERSISGNSAVSSSGRSSGEFHSLSDHSQETFASEQASFMSERPQFPSARIRQHYRMDSTSTKKPQNVKLLMGYAQVSATFTVDGSLIDQSPFEEVKRKGFLGGQAGGGVVGVKSSQASSGFLGGFNLNSIGGSIGGLLGGSDLSSLKEMKTVTSSRAVPLLSTPQSLLFVDIELAPGEEKCFSYRYVLPQGLPSSHRGKAIKVVYNLVIGVQGVPGSKDLQAVRKVNVPFRLFSGVDPDGEIYGHDLMQPYVILQDSAKIEAIEEPSEKLTGSSRQAEEKVQSSADEFLTYVNTLLDKNRRRQSSSATIDAAQILRGMGDPHRAKAAINRAILSSNSIGNDGVRAPNRFEIARNGNHVAVVILNRPCHRLGETVTAIVDFTGAQLHNYSVRASLETTEKVNAALALRSATSITRVTRRVYASQSENTLFEKRMVFRAFIPVSATPTLLTSGVNLNWGLRFEFATITKTSHHDAEGPDELSLLEEVLRDERGVIMAAAESTKCETFEAAIPITVYGDVITVGMDQQEIVGLPI